MIAFTQVRDAVKDLTVAVQKLVGTAALEGHLKTLRPKQLEEYEAAFGAAAGSLSGGGGAAPAAAPAAAPKKAASSAAQPKQSAHQAGGGGAPNSPRTKGGIGAGGRPSPGKHGNKSQAKGADGEVQDFTTCMFCSASDATWNEDALDLHYWKDCAMLAPCPACAQVVEVAGLPEHLLDECEHKGQYVSCDTTALAIKAIEFDEWKTSPQCVRAPANCMYCPLCLTAVEDSDDAWRQHLFKACPKNTRRS